MQRAVPTVLTLVIAVSLLAAGPSGAVAPRKRRRTRANWS